MNGTYHAILDMPLFVARSLDELFIMGDDYHAPLERGNAGGEGAEGIAVQVVCRLVKNNQVRVVPEGGREDKLDLRQRRGSENCQLLWPNRL